MKRTQTVNIGGRVFQIDEDAYERLNLYLSAVEMHFHSEQERKEIMGDIESRFSELFHEKITSYHQVITVQDVEAVIRVLGEPGVFVGEENDAGKQRFYSEPYRRMYRDPDHRVLGGVCSGMGAYWHMDPVIIRILFLAAFFGFGAGLIIYLVLWIVIPPARTTAQKLEMRGEPVTFNNIGRFVKNEFHEVKKNIRL